MEASSIDTALAAAAGADSVLQAELKAAFLQSAQRQIDLLGRARCDGNWQMAALRLRAIAASFHASELIELADEANRAAPGEPTIVRRLSQHVEALANPADR